MDQSGSRRATPAADSDVRLERPDGVVVVRELADGKRRVEVVSLNTSLASDVRSILTTYPLGLLETILDVKGAAYVCDEIARDQDPSYIEKDLSRDLSAFLSPADRKPGLRILDVGCGGGASTMVLSRMFPGAEIVGTDFMPEFLKIAYARREFYNPPGVTILKQEDPLQLPPDIGTFDVIIASAVIEHVLPHERRILLPIVWAALRPGGIFFFNQTPHRWYPIEAHSTNIPLLNYMPAPAAAFVAKALGKADPHETWDELLRHGFRGTTEREVVTLLTRDDPGSAEVCEPVAPGTDRIDVWYAGLTPGRRERSKRVARAALRIIYKVTGTVLIQNLSVAIRKKTRR